VERRVLSAHISTMAEQGLRVLGVAKAFFSRSSLPLDQHDFRFEFLGMVGMADPVRPTVPAALKECYAAGIRVVMITGDYPGTAQNIANQIGLVPSDEYITGPELDAMSDEELQERIRTVSIFARVVPEQKLRLVQALKANGEVTAMTGDGVNDAPALKAADIGIAMGERGTDVAREAAALVLLDDDFSSIEGAVKMGRRIFDNLKKAMAYIVAVHVPIAGMSFIPVIFKLPLVLMPVHIAFLELIIDPACSVVFEAEPEEADVMRRPPRDPQEPLFNRRTLVLSLLQGLSVLLFVSLVFALSHWRGQSDDEVRAVAFTTLVLSNLALIFINRSWQGTIKSTMREKNPALWWITGGTLVLLGLVLYIPFTQKLFGFAAPHIEDLAICLAASILSVLWFELFKIFMRRRMRVN
jgi:Ca2+-transporting ATPase